MKWGYSGVQGVTRESIFNQGYCDLSHRSIGVALYLPELCEETSPREILPRFGTFPVCIRNLISKFRRSEVTFLLLWFRRELLLVGDLCFGFRQIGIWGSTCTFAAIAIKILFFTHTRDFNNNKWFRAGYKTLSCL